MQQTQHVLINDSEKRLNGRVGWLDSLRGISAFLVITLHIHSYILSNYSVQSTSFNKAVSYVINGYLDFGKIGVVTFFIISGYVIPYSFAGKTDKAFFISRLFRLYPAYWVSILAVITLCGYPTLKVVIINFTMLQRFINTPDLIGVYWTLPFEIIFYVLCAVLNHFKLLDNNKVILKTILYLIIITLALSVVRYVYNIKLPIALFLGLTVMFLGFAWRQYTVAKFSYNKKPLTQLLLLFVVALIPITIFAYSKDYGYHETWYRYFNSYFVSLVLFYLFSKHKFSNKALSYLGSISYSLYLLHPVFGLALTPIIMKIFDTQNMYVYIFIFITSTIASASLCYFCVEKPCIRLGKQLQKKQDTLIIK